MKMMNEIFRTKKSAGLIYIIGGVVLVLVTFVPPINLTRILIVVGLVVLFLGWETLATALGTRVSLEEGKLKSVWDFWKKNEIDIASISRVERQLAIKGAPFLGHRMLVYHTDQTDLKGVFEIPENNYSEETIVRLLQKLKSTNPSIELDAEYTELHQKINIQTSG